MRKNSKSRWMIGCGISLMAAAVVLGGINVHEAQNAAEVCCEDLLALKEVMQQHNSQQQAEQIAVYEAFKAVEMPVIEIKDKEYIGTIQIPSLELELPVQKEWSDSKLKKAPCCYQGSVYQDNIIIAAHNYGKHFGKIGELDLQEQIIFTDAVGNTFIYEVTGVEILAGTDLEKMESGEWDMTLFTCTYGGKNRVTVRCEKKKLTNSL